VGPVWRGGSSDEEALLASAYRSCLALAIEYSVKTIAFPNISTGVYGFPKELAAKTALHAVREFCAKNEGLEEITFVCFDQENFELYSRLMADAS
jgi:O-acetyl-ADP-ribose deacetylase (regulator of RNase III)